MPSPIQTTSQTTIPTLHHLAHSQSHRCLWMLEEIALLDPSFTYNLKLYPRRFPHNKDLRALTPLGKSPVLTLCPLPSSSSSSSPLPTPQLTPGLLTESLLILSYLNTTHASSHFTPRSPSDAHRDAFFAHFSKSSLEAATGYLLAVEMPGLLAPWPVAWAYRVLGGPLARRGREELGRIWGVLDGALALEGEGEGDKRWFGGREMGVSDFGMSWGVEMGVARGWCDLSKYDRLRDWYERIQAREAKKRALEKGGKLDLVYFGYRDEKVGIADIVYSGHGKD